MAEFCVLLTFYYWLIEMIDSKNLYLKLSTLPSKIYHILDELEVLAHSLYCKCFKKVCKDSWLTQYVIFLIGYNSLSDPSPMVNIGTAIKCFWLITFMYTYVSNILFEIKSDLKNTRTFHSPDYAF